MSILHPNRRKGRKPDREYLDFIRSCPCCVCTRYHHEEAIRLFRAMGLLYVVPQRTRSEAAHVGPRGLGQKSNDRETIPLCNRHHRRTGGRESYHVLGKRFWTYHNLDRAALIAGYQRLFETREVAA